MNKRIRRFAVLHSICLSMIASSAAGALAADFDDTKDHWAESAINVWSDHDIIIGHDGAFRPDDTVTRGELAVMLDRIMGYQETAENVYSDLDDTWYTEAVLKLVSSGVLQGYDNEMRPEDPVTREEASVMLTRALQIALQSGDAPSFTDTDSISEWAAEAIYALAHKGYVNGFEDNAFRPQNSMSRAEFVTIINNAVKGFYKSAGTYTADEKLSGIVIVNSSDVVLENMEIDGDLILAPGVKDGIVTLKNTTVSGEIITQGGSVYEDNGSGDDGGEDNGGETPEATPKPTAAPGGGGSGGSSGGSDIAIASESSIIVNRSYADKTGSVISGGNRYTIGKNAFSSLKEAVEKANSLDKKANIRLLSNIASDSSVEVMGSNITIDGGNYTIEFAEGVKDGIQAVNAEGFSLKRVSIKMNDEADKWNGSYGVQVYGGNAELSNISVTGADAAVLVNGSEVTLDGTVDVSGNEFGGIEVSKGAEIQTSPKLKGSASNLKNDSESASKPTVWIDKVSALTESVVEVSGLEKIDISEKDQAHFFINGIPESMQAEASTPEELSDAVSNPEIKVITITDEITADEALSINRSVVIKGQGAARSAEAGITFDNTDGIEIVNAGNVTLEDINIKIINNAEGWQGLYGVQAYGTSEVSLKNISVTGADAGILVNGANVTLDGVVDVSGNAFGGIEVAKGIEAETAPLLTGSAENLKNDTETEEQPTIWIDKLSELTESVVAVDGLNKKANNEKDQMFYYLSIETEEEEDITSADVSSLEELEDALADENIKTINVSGSIEADKVISVTRPVSVAGVEGASIIFDNTDGVEIVNAGEVTFENISFEVINNAEDWQGLYGIQAYGASNVTLSNVSVSGADAAILVNGANVTLDGVVDVSGNEFGGIEVSKGSLVETAPLLIGSAENLKNDTESASNPTVWIDKVSEITENVVEVSGLNKQEKTEKDQLYFFIGTYADAGISE